MRPVDGITGPHLSSEDCDRWEAFYKKHGLYGTAKKMMRTKSWRSYAQKNSFDYSLTWDELAGTEDHLRTVPSDEPDLIEQTDIRLREQRLVDSLSEGQKAIWELYKDGKTPAEIKDILGYNTTEAIRWQKHKIKEKWMMIRRDEL